MQESRGGSHTHTHTHTLMDTQWIQQIRGDCFTGRLKEKKRKESPYMALSEIRGGCDCHEMLLGQQTIHNIQQKFLHIKQLVQEYDEFYEAWLKKVRAVETDENGHVMPQAV